LNKLNIFGFVILNKSIFNAVLRENIVGIGKCVIK
jgi:hypothetical protein